MIDGWIVVNSEISVIMIGKRNERNFYIYDLGREKCVQGKALLGYVRRHAALVTHYFI